MLSADGFHRLPRETADRCASERAPSCWAIIAVCLLLRCQPKFRPLRCFRRGTGAACLVRLTTWQVPRVAQ